jgi:hypothetical protein
LSGQSKLEVRYLLARLARHDPRAPSLGPDDRF